MLPAKRGHAPQATTGPQQKQIIGFVDLSTCNDVCQLRDNAQRWTDRLLEGLVELFQAKFATLASAQMPSQSGQFFHSDVNLQLGLTPAEIKLWAETYAGPDGTLQSEFRSVGLNGFVDLPAREMNQLSHDSVEVETEPRQEA